MTEAWVQSLFDEEPERYGPKGGPSTGGGGGAQSKDNGTKVGADVRRFEKLIHNPLGAPPLDWWNVSEEEVRRRLILAMCPERVCRTCGEPSRRIVGTAEYVDRLGRTTEPLPAINLGGTYEKGQRNVSWSPSRVAETIGWSDCGHDDWRPGVVLDPFAETEARPS